MTTLATSTALIRFRTLIWLMPAVYAVHIVEEYAGGFPAWVQSIGGDMTDLAFVLNNALFMAILLGLTTWAWARPSQRSAFFLLCWASGNLFWNFIFHLATTVLYNRYSPGLITAVLLYYPVSLAVARAALREQALNRDAFALAAAVGAALMLFVIWAGLLHFAM